MLYLLTYYLQLGQLNLGKKKARGDLITLYNQEVCSQVGVVLPSSRWQDEQK